MRPAPISARKTEAAAVLRAACLIATLGAPPAAAAQDVVPVFSIWDVSLGASVTTISDAAVAEIACGTRGGPPSLALASFADWAVCPTEPSGLREIAFTYDDERDYVARALELEHQALRGGTSVFSNPVIVSVLADAEGVARGLRIVTDDRVGAVDRRNAVTLARNFKARYSDWALACEDLPPSPGEQPVGNQFVHEVCRGVAPGGGERAILLESSYLRKRGQEALSRETQSVNAGYFESRTFFELVETPFAGAGQ